MPKKLTDSIVKALPLPAKGNKITFDTEVKGFGCRVTAAGARAFVIDYRTKSGRERRMTIGRFPAWSTIAARNEAKELKKEVDRGGDPLGEFQSARDAKTVADLVVRFEEEHLHKRREKTVTSYRTIIAGHILPAMRHLKIADVTYSDVDALHRKITKDGAPYQANRTVSVLSKMFSLAIRWKWCSENPCKGIEHNKEEKRERYLSPKELASLSVALGEINDQQAANIIRLLLLTGARSGEVMAAKWEQFNLSEGVWQKPASSTKSKMPHRVPLSGPARQLLNGLRKNAEAAAKGGQISDYVFPGRGSEHRREIKYAWRDASIAAGIVTTVTAKDAKGKERVLVRPSARIHDLRHTYASILASAGKSLPIIGALLGHSQPATTARYAHLMDDPLREATESVGAKIMPGKSADVLPLKGGAA